MTARMEMDNYIELDSDDSDDEDITYTISIFYT